MHTIHFNKGRGALSIQATNQAHGTKQFVLKRHST